MGMWGDRWSKPPLVVAGMVVGASSLPRGCSGSSAPSSSSRVRTSSGSPGSSGSGVFDRHGRFVGVVSGIDMGRYVVPIPLEVIVWVAPVSKIDHEMLKIRILTAHPVGAMQAFPGAAAPRRGGLKD